MGGRLDATLMQEGVSIRHVCETSILQVTRTPPEYARPVAQPAPAGQPKATNTTTRNHDIIRPIARNAGASPWTATGVRTTLQVRNTHASIKFFRHEYQGAKVPPSPNTNAHARTDARTPSERKHPRSGRVPHRGRRLVRRAAARIARISPAVPSED